MKGDYFFGHLPEQMVRVREEYYRGLSLLFYLKRQTFLSPIPDFWTRDLFDVYFILAMSFHGQGD